MVRARNFRESLLTEENRVILDIGKQKKRCTLTRKWKKSLSPVHGHHFNFHENCFKRTKILSQRTCLYLFHRDKKKLNEIM